MKTYIGIDPGADGGIALMIGRIIKRLELKETRRKDILNWLMEHIGLEEDVLICLEYPAPTIFGAAKGSVAKLYGSFTELRMACIACGVEPKEVPPKQWIRYYGIPARKSGESKTHWKSRLRDLARRKFPGVNIPMNLADAMLIANYCKETDGEEKEEYTK